MRVRELAEWLGATFEGDSEKDISGVAPLDSAGSFDARRLSRRNPEQIF